MCSLLQLQQHCQRFLDEIFDSLSAAPLELGRVVSHLAKQARLKFLDSGSLAVSAFVVRFFGYEMKARDRGVCPVFILFFVFVFRSVMRPGLFCFTSSPPLVLLASFISLFSDAFRGYLKAPLEAGERFSLSLASRRTLALVDEVITCLVNSVIGAKDSNLKSCCSAVLEKYSMWFRNG
jgi:hypothetical protein